MIWRYLLSPKFLYDIHESTRGHAFQKNICLSLVPSQQRARKSAALRSENAQEDWQVKIEKEKAFL